MVGTKPIEVETREELESDQPRTAMMFSSTWPNRRLNMRRVDRGWQEAQHPTMNDCASDVPVQPSARVH
jgi:hypothetical protein